MLQQNFVKILILLVYAHILVECTGLCCPPWRFDGSPKPMNCRGTVLSEVEYDSEAFSDEPEESCDEG